MKRLFVIAAIFLTSCASPAQKELTEYIAANKPRAGVSLKWSEYYEGAYQRGVAANVPPASLSVANKLIYLSKQYESGAIDKDSFIYQQRGLLADGVQIEQQRAAQESADRSARILAAAQIMQATQPRVLAPPTPVVAAPPATITGFLKGQSVSGMLRYCTYTNGVVSTVGSAELCPMQTQ